MQHDRILRDHDLTHVAVVLIDNVGMLRRQRRL